MVVSSIASIFRSVSVPGGNDTTVKIFYKRDEPSSSQQQNKFPILIFLGGSSCPAESYSWLGIRFAKLGYCVVVPQCVVALDAKKIVMAVFPLHRDMSRTQTVKGYRKGIGTACLQAILTDLAFLNQHYPQLQSKLNLDCIIVGGHSAGGTHALDLVIHQEYHGISNVKAVFTYASSLINTVYIPCYQAGTVRPCESKTPPPILIMGGSCDGILAKRSPSNNAAEHILRTVQEGFVNAPIVYDETAVVEVHAIVFKGANHMMLCHPVDETSPVMVHDLPSQVNEDELRKVLFQTICEFLTHHGFMPTHQKPASPSFDPVKVVPAEFLDQHVSFRSNKAGEEKR